VSRKKWIIIGVAFAAMAIGLIVTLLVPGDKGSATSHPSSFAAVYVPCMVAIMVSMCARRKREESKRNG
jgi:uncharacterized membrane protein YhaH (DUF805 family)